MKRLSLLLLLFTLIQYTHAQSFSDWAIPSQKMVLKNEHGEVARMWMGPGLKYADINYQEKSYRVFYHRDNPIIARARIIDNESKKLVARGRGSFFWRTGKFVFDSGEEIKIVRKDKANGYDILGPYGMLFKVENHGITPVKIYNEMDFLAHAFFMFDRIRHIETPPAEVMLIAPLPN